MKSLIEKFQTREFVQNVVIDTAGKTIMLIIGLMIGYFLKNWLL